MEQKPIIQAIILADYIYVDEAKGRVVIAGTFNAFTIARTPAAFDKVTYLYVSVTEVYREIRMTLRYTDLSTNEVLWQTPPLSVRAQDPLESVGIVVSVPPFPIPHPGTYVFEPYIENESLGALRVTAHQAR